MAEFSLTKIGQAHVENNIRLVWKFMARYPIQRSHRISREQYESELMLVLIKCSAHWDEKVAAFSTYCWRSFLRTRWRMIYGRSGGNSKPEPKMVALPLEGAFLEGREGDPSGSLTTDDSMKRVIEVMTENPVDGNILNAHYLRGMSFSEIGKVAGVSREATRMRVLAAARRIRKKIEEGRV